MTKIINTPTNHILMVDFKPTYTTRNPTIPQGRHPAALILKYNADAVSAEHYQGNFGNAAQAQMVIGSDLSSSLAFEMTIMEFGHAVIAYYVSPTGFGGTSVEIVFDDDHAGDAIQFYNHLPDNITRKTVERMAKKFPNIASLIEKAFG